MCRRRHLRTVIHYDLQATAVTLFNSNLFQESWGWGRSQFGAACIWFETLLILPNLWIFRPLPAYGDSDNGFHSNAANSLGGDSNLFKLKATSVTKGELDSVLGWTLRLTADDVFGMVRIITLFIISTQLFLCLKISISGMKFIRVAPSPSCLACQ